MELKDIAARFALDVATPQALIDAALGELDAGRVTPSAAELASRAPTSVAELGPLFRALLREAGQPIPQRDEAVGVVVAARWRALVAGEVDAEACLRLILAEVYWPGRDRLGYYEDPGSAWDLDRLARLGAAWEEHRRMSAQLPAAGRAAAEAETQALAALTREEAERWLQRWAAP